MGVRRSGAKLGICYPRTFRSTAPSVIYKRAIFSVRLLLLSVLLLTAGCGGEEEPGEPVQEEETTP